MIYWNHETAIQIFVKLFLDDSGNKNVYLKYEGSGVKKQD